MIKLSEKQHIIISVYLEDKSQRSIARETGIDIYEALKEKNYDISYSTVNNHINKLLRNGAEAYIKAEYKLDDVCEFDWGEVKLTIDGVNRSLQMAVFTSAKGNYRYAHLFTK